MSRPRRRSRSRWDEFPRYWPAYVPQAERRRAAAQKSAELARRGRALDPVRIEGRTLARTFWGRAWCRNLERYSDYSNRLPRGRAYVRDGAVLDLQVTAGRIRAEVLGTRLYTVEIDIHPLPAAKWQALVSECAGRIESLVELLRGRFSETVMEIIARPETGLFPAPAEIRFACSCPDWASMCKHVSAVLYGVGVRLDERPELLFLLRGVNQEELVAQAGRAPVRKLPEDRRRILDGSDLAGLFGIELEAVEPASDREVAKTKPSRSVCRPSKAAAPRSESKAVPGPEPDTPTEATGRRTFPGPRIPNRWTVGRARRAAEAARWVRSHRPPGDAAAKRRPAGGRRDGAGTRAAAPVKPPPRRRPGRDSAPADRPRIPPGVGFLLIQDRVQARQLTGLGIPHPVIQAWLRARVLEHAGIRGCYRLTPRTAAQVLSYLARKDRHDQ
jgi:uncharacterized Zn finger protein